MHSRAARRSADRPAAFSVPFLAGQKGDTLRPEPEGRLYGMSFQANRGDQRLDVTGKDTFSDLHSARAHQV